MFDQMESWFDLEERILLRWLRLVHVHLLEQRITVTPPPPTGKNIFLKKKKKYFWEEKKRTPRPFADGKIKVLRRTGFSAGVWGGDLTVLFSWMLWEKTTRDDELKLSLLSHLHLFNRAAIISFVLFGAFAIIFNIFSFPNIHANVSNIFSIDFRNVLSALSIP